MMKYFGLFFYSIVLYGGIVSSVSAQIRINEIAWQGYQGDANNEWIELYNEGSESINLDGWLLQSADGTPSINLSGSTINAGQYFLLERTDDTTVPNITADKIYSGALGNEGENLILKNQDGTTISSANFSSGWEMPSNSTGTLSFFSGGWSVGIPTPRAVNQSSGDSLETISETNEETETKEEIVETKDKKITYKEKKLTVQGGQYAFVGIPYTVSSHLRDMDGSEIRKGIYSWNMGDGEVLYRLKKEDISYTYQYPGEYVISLSYNVSTFGEDPRDLTPELYDDHIVQVFDSFVSFESVIDEGTVVLKNTSSQNINLEYWKLTDNINTFHIPKNTIIRAGKTATFSKKHTKITTTPVFLIDPTGKIVHYFPFESSKIPANTFVEKTYSQNREEKTETVLGEFISEEEVLSLEDEFASLSEKNLASASHSNQKTIFVVLFVFLLCITGVVFWVLLSTRKEPTIVEGYEIIEE